MSATTDKVTDLLTAAGYGTSSGGLVVGTWLASNWLACLSAIGIIVTVIFQIRQDRRQQRKERRERNT